MEEEEECSGTYQEVEVTYLALTWQCPYQEEEAKVSAYIEPGSCPGEARGPAHPQSDSLDSGHESHSFLTQLSYQPTREPHWHKPDSTIGKRMKTEEADSGEQLRLREGRRKRKEAQNTRVYLAFQADTPLFPLKS